MQLPMLTEEVRQRILREVKEERAARLIGLKELPAPNGSATNGGAVHHAE
jgi:hypothetical protein